MILSATTGPIEKRLGYECAIRMIGDAGFDAYDIDMCKMHVKDDPLAKDDYLEVVDRLRAVAEEKGIVCNQAHAPFPTQLNGNDVYNKMTRKCILRSMEVASLLGAKILVVHPIKNSSSSQAKGYSYEPFESRAALYEANLRFFRELIPYCEKYNVKIAVENMWERHILKNDVLIPSTLGFAEEHAAFIDALDSEWIVGCLDTGHTLICSEKLDESVRRLGARLKSLHVHDSNGYEDSHALPYSMKTDWDAFLGALAEIGYDGDFTFEANSFFNHFPDGLLPTALRFMCDVGRHMVGKIASHPNRT